MKHARTSRGGKFGAYDRRAEDDGMGELERVVFSEIDLLFGDKHLPNEAVETDAEADVTPAESDPPSSAESFADELVAMIAARADHEAVVASLCAQLFASPLAADRSTGEVQTDAAVVPA